MYINDGKVLGIDTAVEIAALKIAAKRRPVKINIGFGNIVINPKITENDILRPVEVLRWEEAPINEKCIRNELRNKENAYYATLLYRPNMPTEVTKWLVSMAVCKAMLMEITGKQYYAVYSTEVQALVFAYHSCYDDYNPMSLKISRYVSLVMGTSFINRMDSLKRQLLEDKMESMMKDGEEYRQKSIYDIRNQAVKDFAVDNIHNSFYRDLIAIGISMTYLDNYRSGRHDPTKEYYEWLISEMTKETGVVNAFDLCKAIIKSDRIDEFEDIRMKKVKAEQAKVEKEEKKKEQAVPPKKSSGKKRATNSKRSITKRDETAISTSPAGSEQQ